jgi:hypothetical protein
MLKKILFCSLMIVLLAACAPQDASPRGYPNPGYPSAGDSITNSETPALPEADSYLPRPTDSELIRDTAHVDSYQLLTLESSPLQFNLTLTGGLPTPCHQLRVAVSAPDADNKINVEVYSVSKPDAICAMMIQQFEVNVPLGSFPSGHYLLLINGNQATEFDS